MVSDSLIGPGRGRLLGGLLLAGVAGFLLLTLLAALRYPGGTYCEPAATSYRFWGNYFCDLTGPVTARGEDNSRSAALAEAAFASFALATGPFFWLLGGLSSWPRSVRALGLVAAAGTAALAWVPARAGATVHATAVFSATIPGLAAAGAGMVGTLRARHRSPLVRASAWLGVATFAAGLADAAGYARAVAANVGCIPWLPVLQKVTGLCLVSWMSLVAIAALAALAGRSSAAVPQNQANRPG